MCEPCEFVETRNVAERPSKAAARGVDWLDLSRFSPFGFLDEDELRGRRAFQRIRRSSQTTVQFRSNDHMKVFTQEAQPPDGAEWWKINMYHGDHSPRSIEAVQNKIGGSIRDRIDGEGGVLSSVSYVVYVLSIYVELAVKPTRHS